MLDHLNLSLAQPTHRTDVIPPFSGRKGVIKQRSCESSKEILESLRSGTYVRHGLGRIEGLPEGLPADGTQQAIQAFVDRFIDQPIERTAYEPALRHLAKEAIAFEESQPPFPSGYAAFRDFLLHKARSLQLKSEVLVGYVTSGRHKELTARGYTFDDQYFAPYDQSLPPKLQHTDLVHMVQSIIFVETLNDWGYDGLEIYKNLGKVDTKTLDWSNYFNPQYYEKGKAPPVDLFGFLFDRGLMERRGLDLGMGDQRAVAALRFNIPELRDRWFEGDLRSHWRTAQGFFEC